MKLFSWKSAKPAAPKKQTFRAAVARRASRAASIEGDEEEPTTSFKTALVVVLLLHVVAGGGILMFEKIKTRRPHAFEAPQPVAAAIPKTVTAPAPQAAAITSAAAAAIPAPKTKTVAPVAATEPVKRTAPAVAPVASAEIKDTGHLYTVAKGDTPKLIAKRLNLNYEELLKLNRIEDPKKLRIGQKLHLPFPIKTRASNN